jgi:glycosyltransferase involved in cell wall biosynthesis
MRLSIIIPAYNVAGFIEKCIRSLEAQDIPTTDYEIIVTNDGSPDNCKEIVENLQKEFSNLILINQENQGVSMARNNAIARARGQYILPIDPDDYVLPNCFSRILDHADRINCDVFYLGFEIFDSEHKSIWKSDYQSQKNKIYSGLEGYFAARGYEVKDPDRSWGILFRKQLLDTFAINYPKNVPYLEDGLFLAKVFVVAQSVAFDNMIFYQRTTRKGSATNSRLFFSEKTLQGFIYAIQDINEFGNRQHLIKEQTQLINHVIAKFVLLSLSPSMGSFKFADYFKVIAILKKAGLGKLETDGLRFLYKKHIEMYNFSKLLFPFYFRFTNKVN